MGIITVPLKHCRWVKVQGIGLRVKNCFCYAQTLMTVFPQTMQSPWVSCLLSEGSTNGYVNACYTWSSSARSLSAFQSEFPELLEGGYIGDSIGGY